MFALRDNPSNPHNLRLIKSREGAERISKIDDFSEGAGFLAKQLNTFLSLYEREILVANARSFFDHELNELNEWALRFFARFARGSLVNRLH